MSTNNIEMSPQTKLWAQSALTGDGWADRVTVHITADGVIKSVESETDKPPDAMHCPVLLPAIANVHSHAFQRALAGLSEGPKSTTHDSFWTWREHMYRFLDQLGPDDVEAIAAYVFMESLETGCAAIGEFHYLHHQPNGAPYSDIAEMSARVAAAAAHTGIGLTLLPVLYQQGGCDGRPTTAAQRRFANDFDRFAKLHESASRVVAGIAPDCITGVAPHSLRAVPPDALTRVQLLAPNNPVHLHIAEQTAEVDEVIAAWGQRPVEWLLDHQAVNERWCLVHATQTSRDETLRLAATNAIAGLCPITEANLGDGIFDGLTYLQAGGRIGIGSDSNIRISMVEELRLLEYSQRLRDHTRSVLASSDQSTGRKLYESSAIGGAQATGRHAGKIAPGYLADVVSLDAESITLTGLKADTLLDSYVFAGTHDLITDVWSAGRHMVREGRHVNADAITDQYRRTIKKLRALL